MNLFEGGVRREVAVGNVVGRGKVVLLRDSERLWGRRIASSWGTREGRKKEDAREEGRTVFDEFVVRS